MDPNPIVESGYDSAEPLRVAEDEQFVQIKEGEVSVPPRSIGIITPHNKRTYSGKGRARTIHQRTAYNALTSPSNVDTPRNGGVEEEEELSISTKGTPRQNPRGDLAAEETHEGAQDEAVVDVSYPKELPRGQHRAKNAKNALRQSLYTRPGRGSDASAVPEPERPAISPNTDSSKLNRSSFSPAINRISPTNTQSDPPEVDGESTQSVEVPVSDLPKRRRGRPRKSKVVPKEVSPSTATPQLITLGNQRDGLGSNGKGKSVLQLYARQLIYAQVSTRSQE